MAVEIGMIPAVLVRSQAFVAGRRAAAAFENGKRPLQQGLRIARRGPDEAGATGRGVVEKDLDLAAACTAFVERRAVPAADVRRIDIEEACRRDAERLGNGGEDDPPGGRTGGHLQLVRQ